MAEPLQLERPAPIIPWKVVEAEKVVEAALKSPLMREIVADVERKLFDVTSPDKVNVPPMVPRVDEVDLKLFDIS